MRAFLLLPGFLSRGALSLSLLATAAGAAHAQYPAELSGRLTDAVTGEPIDNVHIEVLGTGLTAVSDGRGEFRIRGLEPGRHTVRFSRLGYATLVREVEVRNGEQARLVLRLGVDPVPLEAVAAEVDRAATPRAITISRAEIERTGARSAADILEGRAGLVVDTRGPTGARTVSIRGSAADQVLVLLDGVPLNGPVTGAADLSTLPASQIESVTVLRGGQSARYGRGAQAGVILIETRATAPPAAVYAGTGSLGTWLGGLEAAGRVAELSWSAGGRLRTVDGRYEYRRPDALGGGSAMRVNGDLTEGDIFLAGRGQLAGGALRLRLGHTRLERGLPGLSFMPAPEAREELARWRGQAAWENVYSRTRVSARLHGVAQSARFSDPSPPIGLPFDSRTDAFTIGGRLAMEVALRGLLESFSGGIEARQQSYESTGFDESAPGGRFDVGAFGAAELVVSRSPRAPRLVAALRLDRDGLDRAWWLTHELTATAALGPTGAHIRHASSYSPPAFGDQFFREGVAVRPNPDLRAERVPNEIGAGAYVEGRVAGAAVGRLAVDGYIADVKGMIIWAPDFQFVWSPRNFDVKRRGLDIEAVLTLIEPALELRAGYSYTRATYDRPGGDEVQVVYRPRHTGYLSALWRPGSWQLGVDLRYIGTRYPVPAPLNPLDPFVTVDLRLRRTFEAGAWQLTPALLVDRLFNNDDSLIFGYPDPGRTIRIELRATPSG